MFISLSHNHDVFYCRGVNKNCKVFRVVRCAVGRGVLTAPQPPHNEIAFSDGFGAMRTSRPTTVRTV